MSSAAELLEWYGEPVEYWRTLWGVPRLHLLGLTTSTNDDARRYTEAGAPELSVVIANQQAAGRGQHGRSWAGLPLKSLHLSAVLRPRGVDHLPALPIRIGLYLARELRERGAEVQVKWPNDLLLRGRKVGGILCESVSGQRSFVIAGIGINVMHDAEDFDEVLRPQATSMRIERVDITVPETAEATISALHSVAPLAGAPLTADELELLRTLDYLHGRRLTVSGVTGIGHGIRADGALLVEQRGELHAVRSGTVQLYNPVS